MAEQRGTSRRQFLKLIAAGAAAGVAGGNRWLSAAEQIAASAPAGKRPNILLIISDEHNASVTGCYGNKLVQTPNLDALADRGVTFDACYTNSPLCVPARLSFTSGKYVSRVGAWNNNCWLPSPDYPSLPRVVKAAGYEPFLCGKMHYDATCRYGFQEIGQMNPGHMTGRGSRAPVDAPSTGRLSSRLREAKPGDDSSIMRHDLQVTKLASEFLRTRGSDKKPFFLLAGYLAPHFPLIVPEKFWRNYEGKVPMPTIPPGYLESLPLNYQMLRRKFEVDNVPPKIVQLGRELYYGLTQWFDEQVGLLLAALKDGGLADNTVVIYTTDHGENMGEHGQWWKNNTFETAGRVPLIVSWPARWAGGQRRTQACSLVDVVQTIAEIAGCKTPEDWNGDSLCHWLDDAGAPWKDLAVSEYYGHNICSGFVMLRRGQYKYIYHTPADESHPAVQELYDLQADPLELKNIAVEPAHKDRIARMHQELLKELGEDPDKTELRCRQDIAKGYGREPKSGKKTKEEAD